MTATDVPMNFPQMPVDFNYYNRIVFVSGSLSASAMLFLVGKRLQKWRGRRVADWGRQLKYLSARPPPSVIYNRQMVSISHQQYIRKTYTKLKLSGRYYSPLIAFNLVLICNSLFDESMRLRDKTHGYAQSRVNQFY